VPAVKKCSLEKTSAIPVLKPLKGWLYLKNLATPSSLDTWHARPDAYKKAKENSIRETRKGWTEERKAEYLETHRLATQHIDRGQMLVAAMQKKYGVDNRQP
jgi:hypothetical protein